MTAKWRLPPLSVPAYALLSVCYLIVALALSTSLWQYHATRGLGVALVLLLWLVAIVVWRWRWAWALKVLLEVSAVLTPLWGEWDGVVPYAVNVASLGLLLSPGMRRWVHVAGHPRVQTST